MSRRSAAEVITRSPTGGFPELSKRMGRGAPWRGEAGKGDMGVGGCRCLSIKCKFQTDRQQHSDTSNFVSAVWAVSGKQPAAWGRCFWRMCWAHRGPMNKPPGGDGTTEVGPEDTERREGGVLERRGLAAGWRQVEGTVLLRRKGPGQRRGAPERRGCLPPQRGAPSEEDRGHVSAPTPPYSGSG